MKRINRFVMVAGIMALAVATRGADGLTQTLQHGLYEEEANQNLDAAIKSYQAVIDQSQEQRKVVATALFRLGECYRKQGKTNEATAQCQRILREFPDQTELVNLSQSYAGNSVKPSGGFSERLVSAQRVQQEFGRPRAHIHSDQAHARRDAGLCRRHSSNSLVDVAMTRRSRRCQTTPACRDLHSLPIPAQLTSAPHRHSLAYVFIRGIEYARTEQQ